MALGSSSWSLTRTALLRPLRSVTEMQSVPVSVQYKCEYTQSTARPSAVTTPEDTTTVCSAPESIGALQEEESSLNVATLFHQLVDICLLSNTSLFVLEYLSHL